jgi:NADH-quinone oxidoreductase subunit G
MSNHYHMPKLPTASSPMVTITVDGKDVQVPGDTNLLEALKTLGIETPHFCYHPDLPVSGNCRQCMVETDGPRGMGFAIACYTPVRAGMKVATPQSSAKVRDARRAVMEYLLVNHPLDCPICDKAGECILQENYMLSGQSESRLRPEVGKAYHANPDHAFVDSKGQKRGGKRVDLGPRVLLDEERCIQCDRCVRFMRHVAGDEQLMLAARGDHTYITTFPGEPLDHPYDVCVTDICPVGALTHKSFRFQKRVWQLTRTPSVSMDDSLGANVWIDHADGAVWRIMPRCNPSVNRSWLANATRAVEPVNENRLLQSASVAELGNALAGTGKVALVAGGACTLEDLAALRELKNALGDRAELFAGSLLPVGKADGIARSGDPVANRKGMQLLGYTQDIAALLARAPEFSVLLTVHADLWGESAEQAQKLTVIPQRLALSASSNATVAQAALSLGVAHWTEVRGTMVNCQGRLQKLQGAATKACATVDPAWKTLARLAGLSWDSEARIFQNLAASVPALAALTYATIGDTGLLLEGV